MLNWRPVVDYELREIEYKRREIEFEQSEREYEMGFPRFCGQLLRKPAH